MRSLVLLILVGACGGGSGESPPCGGLELADCRLTEGCKPDLCELCSCTPQYRGCVAESAQPECPAVGCPSPFCCSTEQQCQASGFTCLQPGESPGCGACNIEEGNCTDDLGCKQQGASMICEPITCSCNGNSACVQGCLGDLDCTGEGQACDLATARCGPRPCADDRRATSRDGGCPANFTCTPAVGCQRTTCASDLDCDGFCVDGACFAGHGECTPPAA